MCTLLYNSKWHQELPSQAQSEESGEGMFGKLVRDQAKKHRLCYCGVNGKPLLVATSWSRWQMLGCAKRSKKAVKMKLTALKIDKGKEGEEM